MLLAAARKIAAHTRRLKQYGDKKKDYLRQPAATISVATSTHSLNKKKKIALRQEFYVNTEKINNRESSK